MSHIIQSTELTSTIIPLLNEHYIYSFFSQFRRNSVYIKHAKTSTGCNLQFFYRKRCIEICLSFNNVTKYHNLAIQKTHISKMRLCLIKRSRGNNYFPYNSIYKITLNHYTTTKQTLYLFVFS